MKIVGQSEVDSYRRAVRCMIPEGLRRHANPETVLAIGPSSGCSRPAVDQIARFFRHHGGSVVVDAGELLALHPADASATDAQKNQDCQEMVSELANESFDRGYHLIVSLGPEEAAVARSLARVSMMLGRPATIVLMRGEPDTDVTRLKAAVSLIAELAAIHPDCCGALDWAGECSFIDTAGLDAVTMQAMLLPKSATQGHPIPSMELETPTATNERPSTDLAPPKPPEYIEMESGSRKVRIKIPPKKPTAPPRDEPVERPDLSRSKEAGALSPAPGTRAVNPKAPPPIPPLPPTLPSTDQETVERRRAQIERIRKQSGAK